MARHETEFQGGGQEPKVSREKLGAVLAHACDIAIVVDRVGIVQSISVNPESRTLGCLDHWEGRALDDFLAVESKPKVEARIAAVRKGDPNAGRPFEVNHVDNANWEFPIRYSAIATGEDDCVILMGRDLRPIAEMQQQLVKTQMALEKDYERARDYETRYRVLMETLSDPVVLVDANSGRIISANETAGRLLGEDPSSLAGSSFSQSFEGRRHRDFIEALNASAASSGPAVSAQLRGNRRLVSINVSRFRSAGEMILLCRIEATDKNAPITQELRDSLHALYEKGADAIVFTNSGGDIRHANEGFLVLCDVVQSADLAGASLAEYLTRGAVDLKVLIDNASRTGRMRSYSTKLKSAYGALVPVEISTTLLKDKNESMFAFVIRDVSRLEAAREGPVSDEGVRNVMELVGSAPLKDLVAATTDVIEKMCIETAVELTRNNRVAAAEMLGLSRQSLYVKLRKYGLLDKAADE